MVTGASRGLGRAVAQALRAEGARVFASATRDENLADVRADGMAGAALDLADASSVEEFARAAAGALGTVDVLINNASVLGHRGDLMDAPSDDVDATVATNLIGTLRLTRALLPSMAEGGAIVNVTSGAAARPGWAGYAVSKAGLDAATHVLREELSPRGLRVIAVDPGGLRTDMRRDAYPDEDPATLPEPASIAPLFVAIATGEDPGERVKAREWVA